jgi:hypothetical protein
MLLNFLLHHLVAPPAGQRDWKNLVEIIIGQVYWDFELIPIEITNVDLGLCNAVIWATWDWMEAWDIPWMSFMGYWSCELFLPEVCFFCPVVQSSVLNLLRYYICTYGLRFFKIVKRFLIPMSLDFSWVSDMSFHRICYLCPEGRLSSPWISCRSQISQLHWVLMTARSNASTYDKMSLSICQFRAETSCCV